jgi:hypothetical protein
MNSKSGKMPESKVAHECFFCRRPFRFGREGHHMTQWDVDRCNPCYEKYRFGGIVVQLHPDLLKHLRRTGIKAKFNPSGFIDWPHG